MASSIDDGEVSDSESEKQTKYKKRRMQEDSPNIGEEEEARLRAVLLARQAEKRERSEKSSSSKKLDRQHRVHKKKKKRREDETLPDAAPRERQKIVFESSKFSAKVSVIEKSTIEPNKDDDTEIGLNIQPPQQIPITIASSSTTDYAHRRKHRKREKRKIDDLSIEQHGQKSISRERDRGIEDKYVRGEHEVDKREKRIQEGWASWKQSLQSTGGAGGVSRSTSSRSTSGADLKGYQQTDRERRSERERPVEKSSSRRRDDQQQLPKGREEHYWNRESRSHKDDRNRRSPYRSAGEEHHSKRYQEAVGWLPQMSRRREVMEISDRNQTSSSSKFVEKSKIVEGRNFKYNRKEQTQTTVVHRKGAGEPSRSLSPSPEPAQPSRSIIPSLGGVVKVDTPTQDEREDKKETLSEVSKSGSSATKSNRSSRSSSSDTDDHGDDEEYRERREYHAGEKNKNVKPKKHYSKFDSTPNEDDKSTDEDVGHPNDNDDEVHDVHGTLSGDEEYDEDEEKPVTNPNEIEPLSPDVNEIVEKEPELPVYFPATMGCRHVEEFECLNKIEEGTYGVVYRAKEKRTDDVVALKRLKMEKEKEGFPITSLREINMLLKAGSHQNIVNVREIVVGSNMDKIYLVMDYVEHDLKSLMETMKQGFLVGEVKTLMQQLLAGVHHLHDNWILHRDLKTSNLLLSHQGILKIGDFGLAREYGSPLKPYTPIVVTLWYRAPELLLGIKEYSTPIDIWSVGCIFAELLTLKPLFTGKSEIEQLNKIFKLLGTPNAKIWQGYDDLPGPKKVQFCEYPYNSLRKHFGATLSDKGFSLMNKLLTYDPVKRISAKTAFADEWFKEEPRPVSSDMFPTWPAKSELSKPAGRKSSPKAPSGGKQYKQSDSDELMMRMKQGQTTAASGFNLKFDAPKFK